MPTQRIKASDTRREGPAALASAIAAIARQVASNRPLAQGRVTSASPSRVLVTLAGFEAAVEVTAADTFSVFPLAVGDLVLCGQVAPGEWSVLMRLSGAVPRIAVKADEIEGNAVSHGEPFEGRKSLLTAYVSPSTTFAGSAVTEVTWAFSREFAVAPVVTAAIQGAGDAMFDLAVVVRAVTPTGVTFAVKNANASSRTARVVAHALGGV